ncbi:MAG: ATP-dependent Clp protease adaptor ClpS [Actinomycetota bacterium]|nr:ATP-dependent Clp protease adaptor ClpS [Actinomycetota bacterium]
MPAVAMPDVTEQDWIVEQVGEVFDHLFAVIIMNSDFTTFAEVEGACVTLFGYTPDDAAALAMKVHTTGEAVAAVIAEQEARRAVRALRRWNVRSRVEPV